MKISVVIPCYNAAPYLPRATHSVKRQGINGTEIIVVDDASTDDTVAVAERLRAEISTLRIIVQSINGGAARARNAGLRQASGQYIGFLDADDTYGDGVFSRVLGVLDEVAWIQAIDFGVRLVNCHREVSELHLRSIASSIPSNLIIRRELAMAIGGFPESPAFRTKLAGEDRAFRDMLRHWGNIRRLNDVFLDHTIHRGSHFDLFMDRAWVEGNQLRFLPHESTDVVRQGMSEYKQQITDRMKLQAGIKNTRTIRVRSNDHNFIFETFDNDASVKHASETLRGETYPDIPFLSNVAGVLDVGANIGASAVTFARRYPSARVVAVEPARRPFILLRGNTSPYAKIECYNIGLFHTTMKRPLFIGGPDTVTSSVFQNTLTTAVQEEIQLVAADQFTGQIGFTGPDIIKIDTEGCELQIVTSMVESFRAAKAVYLEYHSEEDRLAIQDILTQTHILFFGRIPFPHRGELVYVRKDAFPTKTERDRWRISDGRASPHHR